MSFPGNIQGSVELHHNPADDISQLGEFRFIQLANNLVIYAQYFGSHAGRRLR